MEGCLNDFLLFLFGQVRTVTVKDEPMFCLADICKALKLSQPSKVKERFLEKGGNTTHTLTNRVVTFKDIDTVHKRPDGTASRKRFNDNRRHFVSGVDFFKTRCSEVRPFFGQTLPNGFNPNAEITLITETGYLMLVKSFTDDFLTSDHE